MFTYERGELLGKGIESLVPIRYRENHVRHRATFFADPTSRAMGAGAAVIANYDYSKWPNSCAFMIPYVYNSILYIRTRIFA